MEHSLKLLHLATVNNTYKCSEKYFVHSLFESNMIYPLVSCRRQKNGYRCWSLILKISAHVVFKNKYVPRSCYDAPFFTAFSVLNSPIPITWRKTVCIYVSTWHRLDCSNLISERGSIFLLAIPFLQEYLLSSSMKGPSAVPGYRYVVTGNVFGNS